MIKKTLIETNPDLAIEWHPIKNRNLTPHDVTIGYDKKVWWYWDYENINLLIEEFLKN